MPLPFSPGGHMVMGSPPQDSGSSVASPDAAVLDDSDDFNPPLDPAPEPFYDTLSDPRRFAGVQAPASRPHLHLYHVWARARVETGLLARAVVALAATAVSGLSAPPDITPPPRRRQRTASPPLRMRVRWQNWVGLVALPVHVTRDELRFMFEQRFEVLQVRLFHQPSESVDCTGILNSRLERLPFAAVQLTSGADVHKALECVWVVNGSHLLRLVDASGPWMGAFLSDVARAASAAAPAAQRRSAAKAPPPPPPPPPPPLPPPPDRQWEHEPAAGTLPLPRDMPAELPQSQPDLPPPLALASARPPTNPADAPEYVHATAETWGWRAALGLPRALRR
eukprot:TRINITY_DN13235_c0_g1_i1.p1 TRINITY_DN13235_c0_g1~~TRINITY_DN13235_c0_g1_i1.p1  ORF type:complete len:364 (+),score=117.61 TRINITY_DN13235_c0_g1_i1:80-1093(+)